MDQLLNGAIDFHVHCDPDRVPRHIDAIDLARLARSRGMRGLVLKNHWESTAAVAYLVRKMVPGIEVFGGVDLSLAVGGINPAAVEHMVHMKGGWGRIVWMPSMDAENHVRHYREQRPFAAVSRGGELVEAVRQVIAVIARYDLVLETGHSSPEECLMLVREGRRQGVKRMVVTHAAIAPVLMPVAQMCEAATLGAYIEFVYNGLIGPHRLFEIRDYASAIRAVGVRSCILATDLGQVVNPLHPAGLEALLSGLRGQGFSDSEIAVMAKTNPASLLGMEETGGESSRHAAVVADGLKVV